ncbi:MAG: exodeoxyribonuclease VII large subunit [bacterium]
MIKPLPALVYSVTELTKLVKENLESDLRLNSIWVRGEIGTFKCHSSGHMYFTLKDKDSLLRCVMFRRFASHLRFRPSSGLEVLALGQISLYERDGVYQLYVRELQPDGLGAEYLALEQSKKRLAQEGLLAAERKRPLPALPKRVAVVTSPVGAALQDIIAVAQRRFSGVEILLCPVLVQGTEAPAQIIRALKQLNRIQEIDVVILARGGGSREDLWAFNNEQVARQVATSKAPLVSAVGHEIDYTLADLVADVRAPTPSAAAELVFPDRYQIEKDLFHCSKRLDEALSLYLLQRRNMVQQIADREIWRQPTSLVAEHQQAYLYTKSLLFLASDRFVQDQKAQIAELKRALFALDPMAVLKRGFVSAQDYDHGHLVTRAAFVYSGQYLRLKFTDGEVIAQVLPGCKGDDNDHQSKTNEEENKF